MKPDLSLRKPTAELGPYVEIDPVFDPGLWVARMEALGFRFVYLPPCMSVGGSSPADRRGGLWMEMSDQPDVVDAHYALAAECRPDPMTARLNDRAVLDWCRAHRCFGAPPTG